jgi:regulatory protein
VEKRKPAKVHTLMTALEKVRGYCAYQERCQQEVRDKLYELGLHQEEVEQGITVLIGEGFVNEERFATAYAGGKFRIKKWGKVKIRAGLKARKISEYCIKKALAAIDDYEYEKVLQKTISDGMKKASRHKEPLRTRAAVRYAISHGFEPEQVWSAVKLTQEDT